MKALVIGFGSIGKRHVRNLIRLGCADIAVVDPFFESNSLVFEGSHLECRTSLESVERNGYSFALICSPSHLHVNQAIYLAERHIPVFVEKPLSFSLDGVDKLCRLVERNQLVTMVACNLIFSQPLMVLKKAIDAGQLGQVYSAQSHVQHFLPNMRPGANKKDVYAFHREQGGGVSLDSGSHEVQYLQYLFGDVENVVGGGQNRRIFDTDIEESAMFVFRHDSGVVTSLTMDYLSKVRARGIRVTGSEGSFFWDEYGKPPRSHIRFVYGNDRSDEQMVESFDNDPYFEEVAHFVGCVASNRQTLNPISSSARLQKTLLEMRNMEF